MSKVLLDILIVLVIASIGGFFAGAEMALVSLREGQVRSLAKRGRRGMKAARLVADPNRFLSAVQIGTTLATLVSGAFGGVGRSAVFTARDRGARVIAGVLKKQLEAAKSLGAHEVLALDDESALNRAVPVDVVANAVRGRTAERLLGMVKPGGVFASVTGVPPNAKDFPSIRTVAFVSKQDTNTLSYMAAAVAAGKLVIPIDRRLPLKDAAAGHAAVEKGGIGKVLLLP